MESKPQTQGQGSSVSSHPSLELTKAPARELTHEETLAWVHENRAWRKAKKTRSMWARAITAEEVGKEFQTADRAKLMARENAWLCVGVAEEPWFQAWEKIEAKYERGESETKQFAFDDKPYEYHLFRPKPDVTNWAAQVKGSNIAGFSIRPGYDPGNPLHSEQGGYVVKGDTADPYQDKPGDIWLVQQPLFESTYEFLTDEEITAEEPTEKSKIP
ncbi:MAG: hypothetical protein WCH39_00075 [Schlesneria sp.]